MPTSQKHPGLSLRQWRFFLFRLLAGHWVDSADCLREAQVRRQGGYTQGNLSFHPSEKKHPARDGFTNQLLIDMKLVQLCIYSATAIKTSCSIFCFLFWSMQWGQMPRGWHRTGCQVASVRRGWDRLVTDKDGSRQPSPGHSWAHGSAFPTGKVLVRKGRTQLRAKGEGKNVTNSRGNTPQSQQSRRCSIWCPSRGFTPGCRKPTCVEGKSVKEKFQRNLSADSALCTTPCWLLRAECREFGSQGLMLNLGRRGSMERSWFCFYLCFSISTF